MEALRDRSAAAWMKLFDDRWMRTQWPYGSGVWGKREWVAPDVPDDVHRLDRRGRDEPLLGRAARPRDRRARPVGQALRQLAHRQLQGPRDDGARERRAPGDAAGRAVARACSAAPAPATRARRSRPTARRRGCPSPCSCRAACVSTAQLVQPLAHGARVFALETDFDGCMAVVKELARRGLVYLANSMNPLRIEGQKTVAFEIVQQFDWESPDWVILPSGNLGQRGRALRRLQDDARARPRRAHPAALRGAGRAGQPDVPRLRRGQGRGRAHRRPSRRWRAPSRSATP